MQFCLFHTTSNPTSSQMSWWYSRVFLQHDEIKPSQVFSRHLLHKWTFFVAFGTHIYIWVVREKEQLTLPPSPQQLVILLVHSLSKKYFTLCNNEALHFSCLTQCGASTRASQISITRRCLTCQALNQILLLPFFTSQVITGFACGLACIAFLAEFNFNLTRNGSLLIYK